MVTPQPGTVISLPSPERILHPPWEVRVCRRGNQGSVGWEAGLDSLSGVLRSEPGASRVGWVLTGGVQGGPTLCPCDRDLDCVPQGEHPDTAWGVQSPQ